MPTVQTHHRYAAQMKRKHSSIIQEEWGEEGEEFTGLFLASHTKKKGLKTGLKVVQQIEASI